MPAQTVIKVRRDTAANWISADPTLASGEIGFETDTNLLKIGNGTSAWTVLPYASGSGGASVEISETAPADPEEGDVWFNSTDGRAYIYYDSTWVDLNPGIAGPAGPTGATGAPGPGILPSATAPEDTTLVWYNTENGNAYTYYDGFWTSISGLPSIPAGGATGEILAKSSNTDYATQWVAPSGLDFIRAQQIGTAVGSIVLSNVFSSQYDNYRVVVSGGTPSAAVTMSIQMGTTATGYYGGSIRVTQASVSSAEGQSNATAYEIGRGFTGTNQPSMSMDILSPFATTRTAFFVSSVNADTSAAGGARWNSGYLNDTSSYTSFTLSYTGTITGGTVYVYGYRKA